MDFFKKNRKLAAAQSAQLLEVVDSLPVPPTPIKATRGGITIKLADVQLASGVDPKSEGEKFARSNSLPADGKVLLYGIGMGYHVESFLKLYPSLKQITVIEANPEILSALFHHRDLEPLFSDSRFSLLTGRTNKELSEIISTHIGAKGDDWEVIFHPPSYRCLPENFGKLKAVFETMLSDRRFKGRFGDLEKKNIRQNINALSSSSGVSSIYGSLKGKSALIVGAGPSLDRNLLTLDWLKDRTFIMATDTSAPVLLSNGIPFHAVVSVDPQPSSAVHFNFNANSAPLIYFPTTHPWVVERYSGSRLLVIKERHSFFQKAEHLVKDKGLSNAGGSVSCIGLDILAKAGANPIGFIGQDFAFPQGIAYNRSTLSASTTREPAMRSDSDTTQSLTGLSENLTVEMNGGQMGKTHANLLGYLRTFEQIIAANPDRKFVNINSIGAVVRGSPNLVTSGEINNCFGKAQSSPVPMIVGEETEDAALAGEIERVLFS